MKRFLFTLLIFSAAATAQACDLAGKVIKVTDGDTITVLDASYTQHKVRLAGIDAPERNQDFGQASRKRLASHVAGKEICVQGKKLDRYGRRVGKVLSSKVDVNLNMVEEGLAWHFKKYQREQSPSDRLLYAEAEVIARREGKGLWYQPSAIPPWDYRHGTKTPVAELAGEDYTCGTKRYCRQMTSCQEARYILRECGLSRLDGDRDGVPCESVCGGR